MPWPTVHLLRRTAIELSLSHSRGAPWTSRLSHPFFCLFVLHDLTSTHMRSPRHEEGTPIYVQNGRAATKSPPPTSHSLNQKQSAFSHPCNTSRQQTFAAALPNVGHRHKRKALPAQTNGRRQADRKTQPGREGSKDQAAAVTRLRRSDDAALRRRSRRSRTRRMRACMSRWATFIS